MFKYAKIIDEQSKVCLVASGTNENYYKTEGFELLDVEQGPMGVWYLSGYAPALPQPSYKGLRKEAYPAIEEQLDMMYWDRINGTNNWQETIAEIKSRFPKA